MSSSATVTLEAKLEVQSEDSLVISYTVRNARAGRIYVFNALFDVDVQGNRTINPELAYVIPLKDHSIAVGKFLVPIPQGMKVESADMPYLDPVEAGQALAGKILLRLPLRTSDPYRPAIEVPPHLENQKLLVQIGFLDPARAAPREALIEPAKGAGAGHYQCDYGLGVRYQEMIGEQVVLSGPK